MRAEGKSCQVRYLLRGALGKFRMGVEPGAYSRPANREIVKSFQHLFQPSAVALQQTGPSAELLAHG